MLRAPLSFVFFNQNISVLIDQNETALETSRSTVQAYTKTGNKLPLPGDINPKINNLNDSRV